MKIVYCPICSDIVRLTKHDRSCECGRSGGRYFSDGLNAVIWGEAIPLGFTNASFYTALAKRPETGLGSRFEAFVIPMECSTIIGKDNHEE